MYNTQKQNLTQTPLKSILTAINIPDQKAAKENQADLPRVRLIRKTASAPTFDILMNEKSPNGNNNNAGNLINNNESPVKLGRVESIITTEEPEHRPHKYYSFPVRNKRKTVTSKEVIPKIYDVVTLPKVIEISEPIKDEITEPPPPKEVKTARNFSSLCGNMDDKFIYKIEKCRLSVDKQKDYRMFINKIYQRQDQRK